MKVTHFRFVIFSFLFGAVACTSLPVGDALNRVKPGMDKDEVLGMAGNPKHTYRAKGQDHWIYDYYNDGQELTRHLVFENRHLVKVGDPKPPGTVETDADADPEDMESYEKRVHEQQKEHEAGFKDVP